MFSYFFLPCEQNMEKLSDHFIWKSLKEGDLKAFSVLFEAYYPKLYNYGLKISKNASVTEDSLQDFFLYIYEHRENLSDLDEIAPFLFLSYKRFLIRIINRNNKNRTLDVSNETLIDFEFTAEEIMEKQETERFNKTNLPKILNGLPKRQKEAIYLKYYSGLKAKEIAKIMNINYQSVINLLFKAIKSLKEDISIMKLFN